MVEDAQTRDDANELLNAAVNYARRMLRRYGEFGPFGFSLNQQREVFNETVPRKDMPPDPTMLLELLQDQLTERSSKKEIIAAATAVERLAELVEMGTVTPLSLYAGESSYQPRLNQG